MKITRRNFLAAGAAAGSLPLLAQAGARPAATRPSALDAALDAAAARPVLNRKLFKDPVTIETIELLRKGREQIPNTAAPQTILLLTLRAEEDNVPGHE